MSGLVAPMAVWTLEISQNGVYGIYDNEAAAKTSAELIARKPLNWAPFMRNGLVALHDESEPETSDVYFVTMHGVCSTADQRDPLNDGSSAMTEPMSNEKAALAGRVYSILAHGVNHGGLGASQDCPLCAVTPNPFRADA